MIGILSFILLVTNIVALELNSIDNVTIPIINSISKAGDMSYNKNIKNTSAILSLNFVLVNGKEVKNEKISLFINNKTISVPFEKPTKNSMYISNEESDKNKKYTIHLGEVEKIVTGIYTLTINYNKVNYTNSTYVLCDPVVQPFTKKRLGLEGDPMRVACLYDSFPSATEIEWIKFSSRFNDQIKEGNLSRENETRIEPNDRIEFLAGKISGKPNETLYIKSLEMGDIGFYGCVVKYGVKEDIGVIKVTVKDRWAALYPFLGIVAEVLILVTAILAYERYQIRTQNKNKEAYDVNEEENREPAMPLTSNVTQNGTDGNIGDTDTNDAVTPTTDVKPSNADNLRQRPANQDV